MLFRKRISKTCQYCTNGVQTGEAQVICKKKGLVSGDSACRRFRYDPLKRVPPRRKAVDFSKYDSQDFSL